MAPIKRKKSNTTADLLKMAAADLEQDKENTSEQEVAMEVAPEAPVSVLGLANQREPRKKTGEVDHFCFRINENESV